MPLDPIEKIRQTISDTTKQSSGMGRGKRTALVTGSVALGALITSAVLEKSRRTALPWPEQLPPALDAEVREMEIMEGPCRYYVRPGTGIPIVLLHSINATGSSFEMKPLFNLIAQKTERPVFALDWFGFGLSSRPPVRYTPGLYQRQLRRFLSEHVEDQADVIAFSLACEYAATVASAFPVLVRKLVCISPTGVGQDHNHSMWQKTLIGTANSIGAFEVFYSWLTRRESLKRFYEQQLFAPDATVPDELVNYSYTTSHAQGSHYAPRWFLDGSLFMDEFARRIYTNLETPTLFIIPNRAPKTIQDFDRAAEVQAANNRFINVEMIPTGLLPQWEAPDRTSELIENFLQ